MKTKPLTLLCALAAFALSLSLSLWWWSRGDEVAPLPVEPPPVANDAAPTVAEPANTSVPEPERSAAVDATAPTPKAAATATFDILVVDAATQQPVADAEVFWSDAATRERVKQLPKEQARELLDSTERMAQQFGRHTRSDRDGRLHLIADQRGCRVFARAGDRYGELSIEADSVPPAGGHRLSLMRDEQLRVRVLDADGLPAERARIGVSVRSAASFAKTPRYDLVAHSDARGLATFSHLQLARMRHGPGANAAALGCLVGLAIPGLSESPIVLDQSTPLPNEPIELQLPPTASLRIRYTAAGRPIRGLDVVRVLDGTKIGTDQHNRTIGEWVDAEGWAWFRWLPAGVPLFVEPASRVVMHDARMALPALTIGQVVEHRVDLATEAPVLRGRVLDAAGVPMANSSLRGLCGIDKANTRVDLQTDADGRFDLVFSNPSTKPPWSMALELVSSEREELRLELPRREIQLGWNDLGDLQFGSEPLVCAGRLDDYARRRHGTRMWIERQAVDSRTGALTWQPMGRPIVALGRNGAFVARGRIGPGSHRLQILSRDYLPVEPIEFHLGQDDLLVPMRSGAALEVKCQLPANTDASQLRFELVGGPPRRWIPAREEPDALPTDNRRGHADRWQGDAATVRWSAVEPGRYTLRVAVLGGVDPAFELADVVLPLPAAGDPRLAPLDLRSVLRQVALRLVDPKGEVVRGPAHAYPQPQEDPRRWSGALLEERFPHVLLPMRAQSVLVVCEHWRPTSIVVPAEVLEHEVRLGSWPVVEVAVAGTSALPEGCELHLLVRPSTSRTDVTFRVGNAGGRGSGDLADLLRLRDWSRRVHRGEACAVLVGDRPTAIALELRHGQQRVLLQRFSPNEVVAGAPVTITLDAEEVAAAAALAVRDKAK